MAASVSSDEDVKRRQLQQNGRKPDRSDKFGQTVTALMSSDEAQERSAVLLASLASDCKQLVGSSSLAMLEVGHGPGLLLAEATKANSAPTSTFVGVEWSPDMTAMAKETVTDTRATFHSADANGRLPFEDGSFDLVVSAHCVYFWDDLAGSVAEQARLLKPGGLLSVVMTEAAGAWDRDIYKNVKKDDICAVLSEIGLEQVEAKLVSATDFFKQSGKECSAEEVETVRKLAPAQLSGKEGPPPVFSIRGWKSGTTE